MSLMKKDMGGAANCIGLAKLFSDVGIQVDLHLLLCLVENSISKKSMRPSDIVKSREGSFVEIGDTDAEGRLILADAITYASESKPDLIVDGYASPHGFALKPSHAKMLQNADIVFWVVRT